MLSCCPNWKIQRKRVSEKKTPLATRKKKDIMVKWNMHCLGITELYCTMAELRDANSIFIRVIRCGFESSMNSIVGFVPFSLHLEWQILLQKLASFSVCVRHTFSTTLFVCLFIWQPFCVLLHDSCSYNTFYVHNMATIETEFDSHLSQHHID